jgi:hypothetical protein
MLRSTLLCALAWFAVSPGAEAQEPTLLTVAAGQFDVNLRRDPAAELGFQLGPALGRWILRPIVGGMGTTDGATLAYLGAALELGVGRLVVRPSFAPGYYHQGRGKDLGGPIEFRSGLGVSWRLRSRARVGVEFYHLSNAGLGQRNPGEETFALSVSIPLSR